MTYFPQTSIKFSDSPAIDAFGRLRVAAPVPTVFDNSQQYGDDNLFWENAFIGGGSASFLSNESTIQLTAGNTTSGSSAIRQTKAYWHYQPGKSQAVALTFCFDGGAISGVVRRLGYFDANNGIYLEQSGSFINFVLRNFISGSVTENRVSQSAWNVDPLTGGGPSGVTLDLSKAQIFAMDLQWLGTGRVRCGFEINGTTIPAHQFLHANAIGTVYMTSANLPLRYEVYNAGTAGSIPTMRQICAAVISEGGTEQPAGVQFSANNGRLGHTGLGITRTPVLSIRARISGSNGVRNTGQIKLNHFDIITQQDPVFWEIYLNGTLTSASFTDANTQRSLAEFDTGSTAISGGILLDSGYAPAGGTTHITPETARFFKHLPLVYSGLGNIQDVVTICAQDQAAGTTTVWADTCWEEVR